eukprot:4836699-Prymnesium_polylepis.1
MASNPCGTPGVEEVAPERVGCSGRRGRARRCSLAGSCCCDGTSLAGRCSIASNDARTPTSNICEPDPSCTRHSVNGRHHRRRPT